MELIAGQSGPQVNIKTIGVSLAFFRLIRLTPPSSTPHLLSFG